MLELTGVEILKMLNPGQLLERPDVGELVDAAPEEQVAGHLADDRVVRHLLDADRAHPGVTLQDDVVEQVEHQVAGIEADFALPREPVGGEHAPG